MTPLDRLLAELAADPDPLVAGWATDLVFDVREPKLAVSLRLDADVLRFFRGFGAGYQTRINEVLKAFMQARGGAGSASQAISTFISSKRASLSERRLNSVTLPMILVVAGALVPAGGAFGA